MNGRYKSTRDIDRKDAAAQRIPAIITWINRKSQNANVVLKFHAANSPFSTLTNLLTRQTTGTPFTWNPINTYAAETEWISMQRHFSIGKNFRIAFHMFAKIVNGKTRGAVAFIFVINECSRQDETRYQNQMTNKKEKRKKKNQFSLMQSNLFGWLALIYMIVQCQRAFKLSVRICSRRKQHTDIHSVKTIYSNRSWSVFLLCLSLGYHVHALICTDDEIGKHNHHHQHIIVVNACAMRLPAANECEQPKPVFRIISSSSSASYVNFFVCVCVCFSFSSVFLFNTHHICWLRGGTAANDK